MNFPIPKDYQAPEGVKEGEEFQEIATFVFEGKDMKIVSIGDKEIPIDSDSKDKDDEGEKPTKPKGAKQAIREKLQQEGE